MIIISEILKGSEYSLTQFSENKIIELENNIIEKEVKGKPTPYIKCLVRNKEIKLTPVWEWRPMKSHRLYHSLLKEMIF